jgi:hypothetical protein
VHGGEGLSERPVPIKSSTRGTEWAQTTFRQDTPSSKRVPIGIKIDAKCADPELTIAHEVGHVVEATLSKKVEVERQMAEFRKAVSETEAVKRLQKLSTQNVASNSVGKAFRVSTEYVQYLLRNDELWARAYAQWIATESGDTKMLTQVLAVTKKRLAYRDEQWKPDDFKPVAEAMRAIFEKLGWLL